MNRIEIEEEMFSHRIRKSDVWLVYTKNKKCWVCEIGGIEKKEGFYILTLAKRGKSE